MSVYLNHSSVTLARTSPTIGETHCFSRARNKSKWPPLSQVRTLGIAPSSQVRTWLWARREAPPHAAPEGDLRQGGAQALQFNGVGGE